jgi:hypothetical protein
MIRSGRLERAIEPDTRRDMVEAVLFLAYLFTRLRAEPP